MYNINLNKCYKKNISLVGKNVLLLSILLNHTQRDFI